jgi:DNA-binding response OmpR family regulator
MLEDGERDEPGSVTEKPASVAATSPTLLVIDDDSVHQMIICRVAGRAGFEAIGAGSYEEAIRLLSNNVYTAITLDLSLGEHGGVDILHFIAAKDSPTPIIIVSGSGENIRNETLGLAGLLSLNVCDAMPKPVNLAQLRQHLIDLKDRAAVGLSPCRKTAL